MQHGIRLDDLPTSSQEDKILLDAVSRKLPWSKISVLLPGRTDSRVSTCICEPPKTKPLHSKCAKRYRILIKQQEDPEQEDNAAPVSKRPQKRAKKLRETRKGGTRAGDNEAENTPVAGEDGPSTSSADVLPDTQGLTAKPSKPKPKPKPKSTVANPVEHPDNEPILGRGSRSTKGRQTREARENSSHGKQRSVMLAHTGRV